MFKHSRRLYNYQRWWRQLRWYVINERAGGICENPGCNEPATQVHHLVEPVGRRECATDLMALCDGCHYRVHYFPSAANDNEHQLKLQLADSG